MEDHPTADGRGGGDLHLNFWAGTYFGSLKLEPGTCKPQRRKRALFAGPLAKRCSLSSGGWAGRMEDARDSKRRLSCYVRLATSVEILLALGRAAPARTSVWCGGLIQLPGRARTPLALVWGKLILGTVHPTKGFT